MTKMCVKSKLTRSTRRRMKANLTRQLPNRNDATTHSGVFRDRGYITVDMAIEAGDLGEYFSLCQKKSQIRILSREARTQAGVGSGLGPLLAAEPPYQGSGTARAKRFVRWRGVSFTSKPGGPPFEHSIPSTPQQASGRTLAGLPDERVHKGLACVGSDAVCHFRLLCSIQTTAVITATRSSPVLKNRAQVSLTACAGSRGDVETYTRASRKAKHK